VALSRFPIVDVFVEVKTVVLKTRVQLLNENYCKNGIDIIIIA